MTENGKGSRQNSPAAPESAGPSPDATPDDSVTRPAGALIVFARLPVEGRVKTRLAETIGPQAACELYRCFVTDVVLAARRGGSRIHIFVDPPDSESAFRAWLGDDLTYRPQTGVDLGERMAGAFREVFTTHPQAILIGTDCPDLPGPLIDSALQGLFSCDAVIGPAFDGGYYLIGFRREAFLEEVFSGIEWGSNTVFGATMTVLEKTRLNVHVLQEWRDIDKYDDLLSFYERQRGLPRNHLAAVDFLRERFSW